MKRHSVLTLLLPLLMAVNSCQVLSSDCGGQGCELIFDLMLATLQRNGSGVSGASGDNANGSFTDSASGLLWARCPQDSAGNNAYVSGTNNCNVVSQGVFLYCADGTADCDNSKILDGTGSPTSDNGVWNTCTDLTLAGRSDWRVPTIHELVIFHHTIRVNNASLLPVGSPLFWSASARDDSTITAWGFDFQLGVTFSSGKNNLYGVRCVTGLNP